MNNLELAGALDRMRTLMIAVATGGPRIGEVNDDCKQAYEAAADGFRERGREIPVPYSDLWEWYGHWSSGALPSYQSRRTYVADLIAPIIAQVRAGTALPAKPTGWSRVDRGIAEARERLAAARTEERFQTVGLLCREALISAGQEVFDPGRHPVGDVDRVSATDFKRMIEGFVAVELAGGSADEVRKHARSALDLALRLQHQRTATFRDAAICLEATGAVVNIIAIVSGRRDPS